MVEYMTSIAKMDVGLTQEERNLLSVAFKNVIGARRASWRIVSSIEESRKDTEESALATDYRKKIETELQRICNEILDLLEKHLIPSSTVEGDSASASNNEQKEAHVFYYKM